MTILLPSPLYAGTSVLTQGTFASPIPGTPPYQWPGVDPGIVTFSFIGGQGASEVTWTYGVGLEIARVDTGVYQVLLECDVPGRWQVKWIGTDPVASVWTWGFDVSPQPF